MNRAQEPSKRTLYPVVVGASVLAIKYKDGVMMMSDTLASYGSMARYKDISRMRKVNDYTLVGAGGEYSDFQYIVRLMGQETMDDFNEDDGRQLSAKELHAWLSRVMYYRRSRMNPLWNDIVMAGFKDGESFLGNVDMYGTSYTEDIIGTGFGAYLAIPLLRRKWKEGMSKEEAKALLEDAMRVLYYRHATTINKFELGTISADGIEISKPYALPTKWDYARFKNPDLA